MRGRSNTPISRGPRGRCCADGSGARPGVVGVSRGGVASVLVADGCHLAHAGRVSCRARHHRSLARFRHRGVAGRARACARALGREREVMDLLRSMAEARSTRSPSRQLTIADGARGPRARETAMAVAESVLVRLELGGHRLERAADHRLGEPAARSDGARAGGARAVVRGEPTRWRSWKRRPGSRYCSPTRLPAERIDSILAGRATCP